MSNIDYVKLKDCCTVVGGATPKRHIPEYWGNDVPWVTPKDISNIENPILLDAPEYISKLGYKNCATYLLPKDSVLLTSRAPIGNVALAGREMCTNQGFKSLIPGKNVDSAYLYHCMQYMSPKLQALGNGATFKEVSKKIVEEFKIPLPSLEEQTRIAAILDKADAIRRKRKQAIDLTDQLLRSVFLELFGDPVTNPKGWLKKKFGDVTQSRLGKMLDAKQQTGLHQHFYLRNPNIQWGKVVLDDLQKMDFDEKDQKEFKLENGDVLICEGGEVGRAAIWREEMKDCYYQKALHRVRPKKDIVNSEYLCDLMWFLAKYGGLNDHVSSATIAHLTGAKLKTMEIPIPPIDLQNKYAAYVNKYRESKNRLVDSQEVIERLFCSLTENAFRGELSKQTEAA